MPTELIKMINIVAILKVKNRQAFDEFESKAISILRSYNGELITAFEPEKHEKVEVHFIQFPTMSEFSNYKKAPELEALGELRLKAIQSTKIYVSEKVKKYESDSK